jgi:hypothetical protein
MFYGKTLKRGKPAYSHFAFNEHEMEEFASGGDLRGGLDRTYPAQGDGERRPCIVTVSRNLNLFPSGVSTG